MRIFTLLACLLLGSTAVAQTTPPAHQTTLEGDIRRSLVADWTGVLEYRDYSEPASSTKRVQLPTWLSISSNGSALTLHFVYDDGPNKTVDSTETLAFDVSARTYTESEAGHPPLVLQVTGYDQLKDGHGELTMLGPATDNDKPAEMKITLTIRRNLLAWTEEVRPAGSSDAFAFRHRYVFTRSTPPKVTQPR